MDDKLDKLNSQFVEYVLSENIQIKKFENILNVAEKLNGNHKWHVPYDVLTQEIYKKPKSELDRLYFIAMENFSSLNPSEFIEQIKNDTLRNIRLAVCQKKYIAENIKNANEKLEEINDKAQRVSNEFKTIKSGLEKIKDLRSKIYTDFITILGIFTAITFAIFGGLQLIGNCLGNLTGKITLSKIGGILMIASVILLSVYLILVALMIGLSKLLSRSGDKRYKFTGKVTACIVGTIIGLFALGYSFVYFS